MGLGDVQVNDWYRIYTLNDKIDKSPNGDYSEL